MEFESLSKAAAHAHVTRQAIFLAIKKGELKAEKRLINGKTQWVILPADLEAYRAGKYTRDKRKFDGKLLYDVADNRWSVSHAQVVLSKMLNRPYPAHHIYYLIREGELRAHKRGKAWVLCREDILALYEKEAALLKKQKESA